MNETKVCKTCGAVKSLSEFYAHPQMSDGRLNKCKTCFSEYNKEQAKKRDPEKERDRLAAWRAAHPDRWKEIRDRAAKKAQASGTGSRSSVARRQREKSGMVGPVALRNVLERDGMCCSICWRPIVDQKMLTFDHVIPLARGGAHAEENLRPAHRRCNSWKGSRLPEELVGLTVPEPGEFDSWQERQQVQANALRGAASKAWFANATTEQKAARAKKISASKTGKKHPLGHRTGGARVLSPESIAKRTAAVRAAWAAKTPEERAAHSAKVSAGKRRII